MENGYLQIDPQEVTPQKLNGYMLGAVGPRPIAFASTLDKDGIPNLAPFSFFNTFGINPPVLIFSPSRRGRDNTTKHTYQNIRETGEVVINVVSYSMVRQANLASSQFPKGTNEFLKAGFTMQKSIKVQPFRVKESPVQFECRVINVIETGDQGYAGNLIISKVEMMHINPDILNAEGRIDPQKIDLVGRLGGNFYCRASGDAIFEVPMPVNFIGIGVDSLPEHIRHSKILTGNDLGKLGSLQSVPSAEDIIDIREMPEVSFLLSANPAITDKTEYLHKLAKKLLDVDKNEDALKILMLNDVIIKDESWK